MCECESLLHTHWAEAAIFRPSRRGSLAEEITDQLRRRIVSGDLVVGRRLPSVRKLAHLYGVSVPTIERALHGLATLGFIRISRGVGTFVTAPSDRSSLLTYVWRTASSGELAIVRAAIDERAPPIVAGQVRSAASIRMPRTLHDINFTVHERSMHRIGGPEAFIRADLAFHRAVLASTRGVEIGATLYERIGARLMPVLMGVADVQAANATLDDLHMRLSAAVLNGDVTAAARLARCVAIAERRSLRVTLG